MMRGVAVLVALSLSVTAEMSADEVKAKVREGAKHFRDGMAAGDSAVKQEAFTKMNDALVAAAREAKQDAAVASQVETEAGAIDSGDERALFYYFVCDAYCQVSRWQPALRFIQKALALSKKPKYEEKKKEIEAKLR